MKYEFQSFGAAKEFLRERGWNFLRQNLEKEYAVYGHQFDRAYISRFKDEFEEGFHISFWSNNLVSKEKMDHKRATDGKIWM